MSTSMMSVSQVAERLGMSTAAVRDAVARGDLPASRLGGKILRIEPEDLAAWIARTRVRPTTPTEQQPVDERQGELELRSDTTLQHVLA